MQYDCCHRKRGNVNIETDTQGKFCMKMEVEIRVMKLQIEECLGLPELGRDKEESFLEALEDQRISFCCF